MKPEPLKDKRVNTEHLNPLYYENDIKSAVEWFWKEFKWRFNAMKRQEYTPEQFRRQMTKVKEKAFEDVMKTEKQE